MVKIGIIGCGKIAKVRHIPEYYENPIDVYKRQLHALCYAVRTEKALIQAALRVRFPRGKGFIPFPTGLR